MADNAFLSNLCYRKSSKNLGQRQVNCFILSFSVQINFVSIFFGIVNEMYGITHVIKLYDLFDTKVRITFFLYQCLE